MRAPHTVASLALGVALVAAGGAPRPASQAQKCSAPPGEPPLVAIDGRIVDVDPESLERDRIYLIEAVCMDPDDATFNTRRGRPVISVWTHEGPAPLMLPLLEQIHAKQAEYRERHGAPAATLEALGLDPLPAGIEVELFHKGEGWVAVARMHRMVQRCAVLGAGWPSAAIDAEPGRPVCGEPDELRGKGWPGAGD